MFQKLLFSLILLIIFVSSTFSQTLLVTDKDNNEPIEGVAVYSEDFAKVFVTDDNGLITLAPLNESEKLIFRHSAYFEEVLSYTQLKQRDFQVTLEEKIIKINEVVVSANRWEQSKEKVPNEIISIRPEVIEFNNPQTSADLLSGTGLVFVQKSQLGGGSPMLRGFAANSVLIVVDGVRMNNAIFRGGNLQNVINIDANMLDGAEVLFGPGSVMYGSDALGGVMDFHTLKNKFSQNDQLLVRGGALARYNTANNEITANANVNIASRKFSYLGGITLSSYSDLRTGDVRTPEFPDFGKRFEYAKTVNSQDTIVQNEDYNVQRFSGYRQLNVLQKLAWAPSKNIDFLYTFNYSTTTDIPRYERLIQYDENDVLKYTEWYYGPQSWMMNSITSNWYNKSYADFANLVVSWQQFDESRLSRKYQSDTKKEQFEKVDVLTTNLNFEKSLSKKSKLFYGFEYVFNTVTSEAWNRNVLSGERTPTSSRYPDGGSQTHSISGYATYEYTINHKSNVNAGLRYSYNSLYAKILNDAFPYKSITNNSGALTGSASYIIRPSKGWQVNLLASSGYRAPNLDDIAKVFDSSPGNVTVPNPNLKPEYTYTLETSVSRRIGDKTEIAGTVFYTFYIDAMVRDNFSFMGQDSILYDGSISNVQTLVNTGQSRIYGFNTYANINISNLWAVYGSFTFTDGKDISNDQPLRHTTPIFGKVSVFFKKKKFKSELFVNYSGKRKWEDLPPSEQDKPHLYTEDGALGWYTLNLQADYRLNEYFGLNAGFHNLLDQHYRPYSSGISAPGRNFSLALRANF